MAHNVINDTLIISIIIRYIFSKTHIRIAWFVCYETMSIYMYIIQTKYGIGQQELSAFLKGLIMD